MKEKMLVTLCIALLFSTSCGTSQNNNSANKTSTQSETNNSNEHSSSLNTDASDTVTSINETSEKVYYIQHGPSDPADDSKKWVISDEETVRKIDEWFENISAKLDEYTLEEPEDTSDYSNSTDWYAVSTDETRNDENYFTIDLTYRQYTDEQAESIKGTNAYFNFSYRLENYFIPEEDLSDIYTIITGETLEPAE